jgi:hypothetical protein
MKIGCVTAGLAACMFSIAYAQEKLPAEFTGSGMSSGGRQTVATWSIVIES